MSRSGEDFLSALPLKELGNVYRFALRYGIVDVLVHPFDFADTLIRLGYEPFPPVERDGVITGKNLTLPSLSTYVYYLYLIDGPSGLFRGVIPNVCAALINRHLTDYIDSKSPFSKEPPTDTRLCVEFTDENVSFFLKTRFWRLMSTVITLHVSYPLHVIAVRTMARFVTSSTTPQGLRPVIQETWYDELKRINGFGELFAGCQARILREVIGGVISAGTFLAVMKFIQILQPDPNQSEKIEASAEYIGNSVASMYTNPFRNVSDIMAINHTDIPLGNSPFSDPFGTCWECITNLRQDKFWKTSSSPILGGRPYLGPRDLIHDRLHPRDTMFGPYYMPYGPNYQRGFDGIPTMLQIYYDAWRRLGVQPGTGISGFEEIFIKGPARQSSSGSLALSNVKALLSERHSNSMPFYTASYGIFKGSSNPFGI